MLPSFLSHHDERELSVERARRQLRGMVGIVAAENRLTPAEVAHLAAEESLQAISHALHDERIRSEYLTAELRGFKPVDGCQPDPKEKSEK